MATSNSPKKPSTVSDRKKMMSAINKLLKDHNLNGFKVVELKIEPKSVNTLTSCQTLVCGPLEKKIEIHKPDGTVDCMCVPR